MLLVADILKLRAFTRPQRHPKRTAVTSKNGHDSSRRRLGQCTLDRAKGCIRATLLPTPCWSRRGHLACSAVIAAPHQPWHHSTAWIVTGGLVACLTPSACLQQPQHSRFFKISVWELTGPYQAFLESSASAHERFRCHLSMGISVKGSHIGLLGPGIFLLLHLRGFAVT